MQIIITARHMELDAAIKSYINDKLSKLSKYDHKIEEAKVIFSLEKLNCVSEITLTGRKLKLIAIEKDQDLKPSFDKSIASIQKQLKRFRAKMRGRSIKGFFENIKTASFKRKLKEKLPSRIIVADSLEMKPMSPEEAALELEMFDKKFIVFRDSETEKISVLYQRNDGNYGLIIT